MLAPEQKAYVLCEHCQVRLNCVLHLSHRTTREHKKKSLFAYSCVQLGPHVIITLH